MKLSTKKDLGIKIKEIRQSLGKNLREFGELVDDTSDSIVSRWEKGISKPNSYRIKRIAELGDVPIAYLLYNSPEEYLYFNLDVDFKKITSKDIEIDGIFVILSTVVREFCDIKKVDYYNNFNLLIELDLDDLKIFANKQSYENLVFRITQIFLDIFKMTSSGDESALKRILSKSLFDSVIHYRDQNILPSVSFLLNQGFEIMSIDPYELFENKNENDVFLFSKDLILNYFDLLNDYETNKIGHSSLAGHTFRLETHSKILMDMIQKCSDKQKLLYEPIIQFTDSLLNNALKELRDISLDKKN